jgi:hypothetical protein
MVDFTLMLNDAFMAVGDRRAKRAGWAARAVVSSQHAWHVVVSCRPKAGSVQLRQGVKEV